MTQDQGEIVVRDLGSTNGIRINGQRIEMGRLRPGDELSIAHIRYRYETGDLPEMTLADNGSLNHNKSPNLPFGPPLNGPTPHAPASLNENPLAAAVRELQPAGIAERCRIQVIVKMQGEEGAENSSAAENCDACRPNSSP